MRAENLDAPLALPEPMHRPRLRFMTCGSVDDGKSTLIGRLLLESGAIFEDHLTEATRAGGSAELDLSYLVDGLKAEREQGITIDVAYRYFLTPRRAFLIADAPGHEQYTRNQAAAASQTQLAVLLVSASDGIQPQTRRHMAIVSLFGVRDIVIAINKMDKIGFDEEVYTTLTSDLRAIARGLGLNVVAAIPMSAREGDNVVSRSDKMAWYDGPLLLDALERFEWVPPVTAGTILPVALTGRFEGGGRVSFGEVAAGDLFVGQQLRNEAGLTASVKRLWAGGVEVDRAGLGAPVAVALAPEIDLGRGAVLSDNPNLVPVTQVRARLVWLSPEPLQPGKTYELQSGPGQTGATISRVEGRFDLASASLTPSEEPLALNDIAIARINLVTPLPVLPFGENRTLGSFILIDRLTRRTVAAGVVLTVERRSGDTPWQQMQVGAADRARLMGQAPFVIWLTGLSGAGKSTIADLLDRRLHALGRHATVLDGDNLRRGLNTDLGFSDADRSENIRRVGEVAALMADAGLIVIVSLISPLRESRDRARVAAGTERFLEVYVDAPLEVCRQRDPKGMYARATQGGLPRFTGIGAGYEAPLNPDVTLKTAEMTPTDAVEIIVAALHERRMLVER